MTTRSFLRHAAFVVSFVAGAVVVVPVLHAQGTSGALDGRQFVGEIGDKGKPTGFKEEISFKDGKMVSSVCANRFANFPYKAVKKGDTIEFEASASSPKEGTQSWKGTVSGDTLNATSVWTPPGRAPDETWIKAKLRK